MKELINYFVPSLLGGLLMLNAVLLGWLGISIQSQVTELKSLSLTVARIEENIWTKDKQAEFLQKEFYPLKAKVGE